MPFKKQKIIFALCLGLALAAPLSLQARGLVPCGGYEADGSREKPCDVEDIFILIARVTNFLIAMAGLVSVYYIVSGGFWLILSAGNEESITKLKSQISTAILGFVLVLMAFMLVNTLVNYLVTRRYVSDPSSPLYNKDCRFDLANPLTYLKIDPKQCSSLPESTLHQSQGARPAVSAAVRSLSASPVLSFLKPWSGADPYPAVDWGNGDPNIDPSIKTNLNELKANFNSLNQYWQQQGHGLLEVRQVYRPQAYQQHYRSVWEVYAIINNRNNTIGYLCDQTSHLDPSAVKQAYSQATAADKQTLQNEFNKHQVTGPTPAGCVSDHGSGIAMDITPPAGSLYLELIAQAENYGLCHNIAGDAPHFALKNKLPAGTNCSQP